MKTVTVSIGRNYGKIAPDDLMGKPMSDKEWTQFQRGVELFISDNMIGTGFMIETHKGVGVWDGVPEDSAKITALLYNAEIGIGRLKNDLDFLRQTHYQDAIALTVGDSELIGA